MANEIGDAQVSTAVPDLVKAEALLARYASAQVASFVLNEDATVENFGDTVSINIIPVVAVNDVGAGGSVTNQQLSLTESEIVINKFKESTVDIEDKAKKQSKVDLQRNFAIGFGGALGEQQDIDLFAENTNLTLTAGTDGAGGTAGSLTDSSVLDAMGQLDDTKIPKRDRMWFLHPEAERDLLALARFSEAQNTGFARGLQVTDGRISMLYGTPVRTSPLIPLSANSNFVNVLLHKEAWGIATQKNFAMEMFARTKYSQPMSASILYGVKTIRGNHGVQVFSKKP